MRQAQQSIGTFHRIGKKEQKMLVIFFTIFFVLSTWFLTTSADASTGIHKQINFQGKLVSNTGVNVSNNTYSVVFTLYDAPSGGNNLWDETQSVTTNDGLFQVALGSVDTTLGNVNFNQDNLYLGIKVGADSEMTPRVRFSAVPYAFNAHALDGVVATQSATGFTLSGGTSTSKTLGVSNSLTFAGTDGTTITFQGTDTYVGLATTDVLINKSIGSTGLTFSGAITDITTATNENFTLAPNGTGDTIFTTDHDTTFLIGSSANTPAVLSISGGIGNNAAVIINQTNNGDLFAASSSGVTKFIVGNTGAITSANYTTDTGVLYTNASGLFQQTGAGSDGNCLVMSGTTPGWGSCITGGGQDLAQTTSTLNNTTLLGTTTLIGTVSITPTTTTGDIWVQAYLWTNSLSNTNQTITWELRTGTNCSGNLLTSQTSALTSANASDGPSGFLSYVTTNPGISQQNYAICGLSSVASGVSAGGIATATVLDNTGPQGVEGPAGQSDWHVTSLGVLAPNNLTTDLLLGSTATASARFAVINVNSGTPIASLSAGAAGALSLSAGGTITTTANQSLILGDSTSGHVILNPLGRMYVGIGTTTPVATLDVRGTTGLAGGIVPVASISGRTALAALLVDNSGVGDLFTASSSGLSRFVIKQNGTVGIGVNLPTAMFDVAGTASVSSAFNFRTGAGEIQTTAKNTLTLGGTSTGNIIIDSGSGLITLSDNTVIAGTLNQTGAGQVTFSGNVDATNGLDVTTASLTVGGAAFSVTTAGAISSTATGNALTLSGNGAVIAFTGTSGGNQLTTAANQHLSLMPNGTGYVGLNTTTPLATFDVRGNSAHLPAASVSASTSVASLVVNNSGTGDLFTASSSGLSRFVITQAGNVGIGTTTPSQKLDVNGSLRVRNLANTNAVLFTDSTGLVQQTTTGGAGTLCLTSADGGTPVFGSCSGSASTVWSSLSSPNGNLSLAMTTRTSTFNWATGTGSDNLFSMTTDTSSNGTGALLNLATGNSSTVAPLNVSAAGRQVLYVTSAGTMGVGTTTVGNGMLVVNQQNSSGDIFAASQSGNTKFVITNSGSIGVGTTSTLGTFDVRGNSGTAPAATVSASSTFAGLIVNNRGTGDIFTASSSGASRFTVKQSGVIQLGTSTYTSCGALSTDSLGNILCGGATGDTAIFTDANPGAFTDADTNELFNDATAPNLTLNSTTQTVMLSAEIRYTSGGAGDNSPVFRIVREDDGGSTDPACDGTDPEVGQFGEGFTTNNGEIKVSNGTFLDSPASTNTVYYTVCSDADSTLAQNPTINSVKVFLVELGADLAENYYTTDDSIQPGDIVVIDSTLPAGAKKSSEAYGSEVLGIVSTAPGKVLDDWIGRSFGRPIPVALSGRVPVKVSTENGEIKAGDYLTTSSIPGVAMKATKAGFVVGQAMTAYNGNPVGSVMAFVKTAWYDPDAYLLSTDGIKIIKSSDSAAIDVPAKSYEVVDNLGEIVNRVGVFAQAAVGNIRVGYAEAQSMTISGYLNVKDNIRTGILITGELTTDSLVVTTDNISIGGLTLRSYITAIVQDVLSEQQLAIKKDVVTDSVPGLLTQESGEKLFKELLAENTLGASTSAVLAAMPADVAGTASDSAELRGDALVLESLNVEGLATISSTLRVKNNGLIEGMLTVVDTLMTKNVVVSGLATFFDAVVFKGDVLFAGTPTFNKDTAGFAVIKKGFNRVDVVFDDPYEQMPVVNASLSLNEVEKKTNETEETKDVRQQELEEAVLSSNVQYIVTKRTKKGFTILLKRSTEENLTFSWTAIAVDKPQTFESRETTSILSPTPSVLEQSSSPAGDNLEGRGVIDHE